MKKIPTRLSLTMLLALFAGHLHGQTSAVDLYLGPDIQSPKVGQVSLQSPLLGQATPVMDEARAALGWHFADYSGLVDGYVPDAKIGKDLLPVDNALIYAGPSEDSMVLGAFRAGSEVEIVDTGEWWHLRYAGGVPVYFVLDTPPPLPAVTGVAEAEQPAPVATEAPTLFDEAPAGVESSPAAMEETAGPDSNIVLSEKTETTRPGVVGQSYEGTFRRSKRVLGIFRPQAPYYLEAGDGSRIAWVDTRDIVLPGSIQSFLDQRVVLHGERTFLESSRDWVIHARNMRLK